MLRWGRMDRLADAVIITAAEGEDTALRQVVDGARAPWAEIEAPGDYPYPVYASEFESLDAPGQFIRVIMSRPGRMGGDYAGDAATRLQIAYRPKCIAMCGVCAGRPGWTKLGDVIIGDQVWRYDMGERINHSPNAAPRYLYDVDLFSLSPRWLAEVQRAAVDWRDWPGDAEWLAARPRSRDLQALWVLQQIAEGKDPLCDPERDRMCSDWTPVIELLEERGYLDAGTLTDAGRRHLTSTLYKYRRELPAVEPWVIEVGAIGTGSCLVRDVDIWNQLQQTKRLVHGLDMEGSVIGHRAWTAALPFLVVKGVMDHGLSERHRGARPFAARAAAEVLVRLLRRLVEPSVRPDASARPDSPNTDANSDEPPLLLDGPLSAEYIESIILSTIQAMRRREGLSHAHDVFMNWPTDGTLPRPQRLRRHPRLSTYVSRAIDSVIEDRLLAAGGAVGVTGVVGMGGIGKTFLAMHLAQKFFDRGYRVAWVGLLRKNVESALTACAEAFGLTFRAGMSTREKLVGIDFLLRAHLDNDSKLIFVFDNAERFENLSLLLQLCSGFPTLVTTRRREAKAMVDYYIIGTLNDQEVEQYVRAFFDREQAGGYEALEPAERKDVLGLCCRDLGGHPLGIRLGLTALARMTQTTSGSRAGYVRTLLAERSITMLEDDDTRLDGTGGAEYSRSVQACFDWLYAELFASQRPGDREAHALLPLLAALAPVPLGLEDLRNGIVALCGVLAAKADAEDGWESALVRLCEMSTIGQAVEVLAGCSLVDREVRDGMIQVHPIVREYALHLCEIAEPLPVESDAKRLRTVSGPTPLALAKAVQACAFKLSNTSALLFDLTPRLRKIEYQLDDYWNTVKQHFERLYFKLHRWDEAQRILRDLLALAREKGSARVEGLAMVELGELNHRLSEPGALVMMKDGVKLLDAYDDSGSLYLRRWGEAFVFNNRLSPTTASGVREFLAGYRWVLGETKANPPTISGYASGLCKYSSHRSYEEFVHLHAHKSPFLANLAHDLRFMSALLGHHGHQRLDALYERVALRNSSSSAGHWLDDISPMTAIEFEAASVSAQAVPRCRAKEALDTKFDKLTDRARAAGIRGYVVQKERLLTKLLWATEEGDWAQAYELAKQHAETSMLLSPDDAEETSHSGRTLMCLAELCQTEPELLAELRERLDELEREARARFDTEGVGWVLLGRALHAARLGPGHELAAVRLTLQSRRTLRSKCAVHPIFGHFRRQLVDLVDSRLPQFADIQDEIEHDVRAVDVRPWHVSHVCPLPRRVRSRRTGRCMRLVHGGIQAGPKRDEIEGFPAADAVLYPFYIDELPLAEGGDHPQTSALTWDQAQAHVAEHGLLLPNRYEWFAHVWQLTHGNTPQDTYDIDDALERIASAIDGEVLVRHPMPEDVLPEVDVDISDANWDHVLGPGWLDGVPEVSALLGELFGPPEQLAHDHGRELVEAIASSLCFGPAELLELGPRVRSASRDELEGLREILEREREKWHAVGDESSRRMLARRLERRQRWWRLLAQPDHRPQLAQLRGVDFEWVWLEERSNYAPQSMSARCVLGDHDGRLRMRGLGWISERAKPQRAACLFVHPIFCVSDMDELTPID
jgi:nucleoside phosphorylase